MAKSKTEKSKTEKSKTEKSKTEKSKTEKSKTVRKVMTVIGASAMIAVLPGCAAAGIMNVTERSPRPDPAVESGEIANPVEIRDSPENAPPETKSPETNPPENDAPGIEAPDPSPPGAGGEGSKGSKGKGSKGIPAEMFEGFAPIGDGVREVGEAGEVEFRVEDGILNLVDVRANSGWDSQLGKQDFDEAKVFFVGEGSQWEFEAEIKDGTFLEIETKREIPFAEPGSYEVGEAGEVSFSAADGGIVLDDYAVAEGWISNVEENDFEDVHLKFFDEGGVEYKFEAEYDDGLVEVNIDRKERGSIAAN